MADPTGPKTVRGVGSGITNMLPDCSFKCPLVSVEQVMSRDVVLSLLYSQGRLWYSHFDFLLSMHGCFHWYTALNLYTSHQCMCWRMPLAQHILSAHRAGQRVRGGHAAPVFENCRQVRRLLLGVGSTTARSLCHLSSFAKRSGASSRQAAGRNCCVLGRCPHWRFLHIEPHAECGNGTERPAPGQ